MCEYARKPLQAEDFPSMGRFTVRDEGKTIAMGIIKKIIE